MWAASTPGSNWESLSDADQRELSNLLQGQRPQTLPDQFSQLFTPLNSYRYQVLVENVSANPRCVYTPYGLVESTVDTAQMEFVDDGFLQSSHFFGGTPTYTLEGWGLSETSHYYPNYSNRVLSALLDGYARSQGAESWQDAPGVADVIEQILDEAFTPKEEGALLKCGPVVLFQRPAAIPHPRAAGSSPNRWRLTTNLSMNTTHSCPTDLRDTLLQEYLAEQPPFPGASYGRLLTEALHGRTSSNPTYTSIDMVAQQIASTLAAQCAYTLTPPALPAGEDFVEFFLLGEPPGVLRPLRHSGRGIVPGHGHPRPVCGRVRRPCRSTEEWVDVPDYNAHAWVEVYFGGAGWIPFEVTPAGPDSPAATFNALPPASMEAAPTATPGAHALPHSHSLSPAPPEAPEALPQRPARRPRLPASPLPGEAGAARGKRRPLGLDSRRRHGAGAGCFWQGRCSCGTSWC